VQEKVDFSYAFGVPHRITVALPDASSKTLVDCYPDHLGLSWSYQDLTTFPLGALMIPRTDWRVNVWPEIDGQKLTESHWTRLEGYLPALIQSYTAPQSVVDFEAAGGPTAGLVRISLRNDDSMVHRYSVVLTGLGQHAVPAWADTEIPADHMICAYLERADRLMVLTMGSESMPLRRDAIGKTLCMEWLLAPGQSVTGWVVRPHKAYSAEMPLLRQHDWATEFAEGLEVWRKLGDSLVQVQIPDEGVRNGLYAGLVDCFIMREPVSNGMIAGCPGTEGYRAAGPGEPAIVAIGLDQFGAPKEAIREIEMELNQQGQDGCWADPEGWGRTFWACSGFKSWSIYEHYLMTRDLDFLANYYSRLLASTRFQAGARARTRKLNADGSKPLTFGLMPRGFGDCGLWDDDDMVGVYLPHNFWALFADSVTLKSAEFLGRPAEEIAEITGIVDTARRDLLDAVERGAITETDAVTGESYRWIPGVPGKTSGSRWGALNVAVPGHILPAQHELITGTLRYIEANMSPGGQPVRTGWMQDGMWVAITLDNLAETHLARGEGDVACEYLYSSLNHGTPLYSWCEERGQEPGSQKIAGDRQHLWTPIAVVRAVRDMLVLEEGMGLQLALGIGRTWLMSGKPVGISNAPTHFGSVSYMMRYDAANGLVTGKVQLPYGREPSWLKLHVRMPLGKSMSLVQGPVLEGDTLTWQTPKGLLEFCLKVS
jgi:hypothetical protein